MEHQVSEIADFFINAPGILLAFFPNDLVGCNLVKVATFFSDQDIADALSSVSERRITPNEVNSKIAVEVLRESSDSDKQEKTAMAILQEFFDIRAENLKVPIKLFDHIGGRSSNRYYRLAYFNQGMIAVAEWLQTHTTEQDDKLALPILQRLFGLMSKPKQQELHVKLEGAQSPTDQVGLILDSINEYDVNPDRFTQLLKPILSTVASNFRASELRRISRLSETARENGPEFTVLPENMVPAETSESEEDDNPDEEDGSKYLAGQVAATEPVNNDQPTNSEHQVTVPTFTVISPGGVTKTGSPSLNSKVAANGISKDATEANVISEPCAHDDFRRSDIDTTAAADQIPAAEQTLTRAAPTILPPPTNSLGGEGGAIEAKAPAQGRGGDKGEGDVDAVVKKPTSGSRDVDNGQDLGGSPGKPVWSKSGELPGK